MSEHFPDYALRELRPGEQLTYFVPTPALAALMRALWKLLLVLGLMIACILFAFLTRTNDSKAYLAVAAGSYLVVYLLSLVFRLARTSYCFTSVRVLAFVGKRLMREFNWKDCAQPANFEPRAGQIGLAKSASDKLQSRLVRIALLVRKPSDFRQFLTGLDASAMNILTPRVSAPPASILAAAQSAWEAAQ